MTKAEAPYVRLLGGPRHLALLAQIDLTAENLAGYRKTADREEYTTTGPKGGQTAYTLIVWRHVD